MNVTKLAGYLMLLITAIYLVVTFAAFGPQYAAAGEIGDKAQKNMGLDTTATNLRFHMGSQLITAVIIIAVLGIAGWWLTTSEVVQIVWIVVIGIFLVFSVVIRGAPVLPMNVLKRSPAAAFYGAQVQMPVAGDLTMSKPGQYIPITRKQTIRVVQAATLQGQASEIVAVDVPQSVTSAYNSCSLPLTVMGNVKGTVSVMYASGATSTKTNDQTGTTVMRKVDVITLPLVAVKSAQSGLPQKN